MLLHTCYAMSGIELRYALRDVRVLPLSPSQPPSAGPGSTIAQLSTAHRVAAYSRAQYCSTAHSVAAQSCSVQYQHSLAQYRTSRSSLVWLSTAAAQRSSVPHTA
eukprot:2476487-Rhodomonas_salina.2